VGSHLEGVESHFEGVESHFEGVESHFEGVETHFYRVEIVCWFFKIHRENHNYLIINLSWQKNQQTISNSCRGLIINYQPKEKNQPKERKSSTQRKKH
jgi:hypothetical protein